jgi:glutaredoxin
VRFITRRRARATRQITLYGKAGCHLCDDARDLLDRLGKRYRVEVEEVDITSDPALFRAYDVRIPVIVIDARIELESPIQERDLRHALKPSRREQGK